MPSKKRVVLPAFFALNVKVAECGGGSALGLTKSTTSSVLPVLRVTDPFLVPMKSPTVLSTENAWTFIPGSANGSGKFLSVQPGGAEVNCLFTFTI
ncbi:MAG: hypothetical protein H7Y59_04325 [Anaerolineales bacterium]|nr:hypothetical protein [Anaerolineales bacterium]